MFLVKISKRIKFITIQEITDRNIPILNKAFNIAFRVYNQSVLQIQTIQVDTEFKPIEYKLRTFDITMIYIT